MRSVRRGLATCAIVVVSATATAARAGISLTIEQPAPGAADVVLRWESEGPGPFTLLERDLADGTRIADALPLDPVADVALTGLSGGRAVLRGATRFASRKDVHAYQLLDESDGSCSNLGCVALRRGFPAGAEAILALPRRTSLRTLGQVLDAFPALESAEIFDVEHCHRIALTEGPSGRAGSDAVVPPGRAIVVRLRATSDLVIAGASDRPVESVTAWRSGGGCGNVSDFVALPWGIAWTGSDNLLCGDFTDRDGDRLPDQCTGGWFDGLHLEDVIALPRHAAQVSNERSIVHQLGVDRWDGQAFVLDPIAGFMVTGGRARDAVALAETLVVDDLGADPACRCADGDGDGDDNCTERLFGTDPSDAASHGPDADGDGRPDDEDDCPLAPDSLQADSDADGIGDACDVDPLDAANPTSDPDADSWPSDLDDCPTAPNPSQADLDFDGAGDDCDPCPAQPNGPGDVDADGIPDDCDACPLDPSPDPDGDSRCADDNCPADANADQADADDDGWGDACDCADLPVEPNPMILRLSAAGGTAAYGWELDWAPVAGFVYDVLTGPLEPLRQSGRLTTSWCLARGLTQPFAGDASRAGAAWYLVRSRGACTAMTWGGGGTAADDRVAEIDAGPIASCP